MSPMHPSQGPHYRVGGEEQPPDPQQKERHLLGVAVVGIVGLVILVVALLVVG